MLIYRLTIIFLAFFSAYAVASPSRSTVCYSNEPSGAFQTFKFTVYNDSSMSSYGNFEAVSNSGFHLNGYLYEQPTTNGKSAYQGRSEKALGAPKEFFILVDGPSSVLFFRDITVMGPTGWESQSLTCAE